MPAPCDIMREVGMPAWKLPIVSTEYIGIMRARRGEVRPSPGAGEALEKVRDAGVEMAIVSSNAEDNVRAILGDAAAASVSHYACGMSIFGKRSHLRKLLRAAGMDAAHAIYIADQTVDFEAARAENIAFGAVTWGFGDAAHLTQLDPKHVFTRMEDLGATLSRGA